MAFGTWAGQMGQGNLGGASANVNKAANASASGKMRDMNQWATDKKALQDALKAARAFLAQTNFAGLKAKDAQKLADDVYKAQERIQNATYNNKGRNEDQPSFIDDVVALEREARTASLGSKLLKMRDQIKLIAKAKDAGMRMDSSLVRPPTRDD